jgi:exosortase
MGDRRAFAPPFAANPRITLGPRFWVGRERAAGAALLIALAALWSFWPTLGQLVRAWLHDSQYSHGILVPLFSFGLLWSRRDRFPAAARPAPVSGFALLAFAAAVRVFGGAIYFAWLDQIALLPFLAGLVLVFGGWPVLRWAAAPLLFLAYMVPLPYRFEILLGFPLQRLATDASTYVLQTLGQPAIAEGTAILIRDFKLSIVKACSGLSMLVTFFTFSTAVCLVVKNSVSDKLLILLSAIPIALVTNILRIVLTGLMHLHVSSESANAFFHDAAGWFMMPLALVFLWAELWVLRRLFVDARARPALR